MKRLTTILTVAALGVATISCQKEEEVYVVGGKADPTTQVRKSTVCKSIDSNSDQFSFDVEYKVETVGNTIRAYADQSGWYSVKVGENQWVEKYSEELKDSDDIWSVLVLDGDTEVCYEESEVLSYDPYSEFHNLTPQK